MMDIILSERMQELIDTLIQAEIQATGLLQIARARRLSFGSDYSHVDDDIVQLIGWLRYMLLLSMLLLSAPWS
jgi:hypothetical protein